MYKKTITYEDYNGVTRTEDFYFNFSKAEVAEMELTFEGGYAAYLTTIIEANDQSQIVAVFKDLLLRAYGEKSPDGRRFIKSPELSEAFSQTEAYSNFFMELASDADEAARFFNGITPQTETPADRPMLTSVV